MAFGRRSRYTCLSIIWIPLAIVSFVWWNTEEFGVIVPTKPKGHPSPGFHIGLHLKPERRRIVIIGAGPTALGAAQRLYELKQEMNNTEIMVLEQRSQPGGLAGSERDERGFLWDMGGHVIFSHYSYFDHTLDRAVPEWNQHVRAAFAFMKGSDGARRFIPYPVQRNIHAMHKLDQEKCLAGLEEISKFPTFASPRDFDEWLLLKFGRGLCELFMRKYNRKVWTVDTREMNAVWVGERVAVPDVEEIRAKIRQADSGKPAKDSAWGPNSFFRFPRHNGTGGIWTAVAKLLPRSWFSFHKKVVGVDADSKVITVESAGVPGSRHTLSYTTLISTVPLDEFVGFLRSNDPSLGKVKRLASQLVYTHTHIVGIGLTGRAPKSLADKSWMYFPDSDSPFYRVTVFSKYSTDHVPKSGEYWSLMCEAAEPKGSKLVSWNRANVISQTIKALVSYGFITVDMIVSKYYHRLDHGYPVPSLNRDRILNAVQPWLEAKDIFSRGRFGGWKYEVGNQDHSLMQGVELVDRVVRGIPEETYASPNLVNSQKNTGRIVRTELPDYEIVVAHYNEELDWVKPYADHAHVYHKGNEEGAPFELYAWERLPNVGREGHTYLHHIINHYNHLSNITVFLQAGFRRHRSFCHTDPLTYVASVKEGVPCKHLREQVIRKWGRIRYRPTKKMRWSNLTLGEFYKVIFGSPPPPAGMPHCYNGCLAASRLMIHKHPVSFYQKAISFLSNDSDPEEGHYIERFWYWMFIERKD
ncbi:uncharacterized protein LOC110991137 [Acanthaster planci]|uniref:Uncharacterized protein LOC110991137 n=1 Tax=Acanthaster planci TaxID=133434 RepID=A0A8B8A2X5_ACAPL|nr:uncharacterized protein LOC110991137 [Acanthaster planci]